MQDRPAIASLDTSLALHKFGVGQPVRRKEDETLLRGKGRYTDDCNLPGQFYAVMVRSPHPHGIIRGIGTEAAKAMPGVCAIYTGADLASAGYAPFSSGLPLKSRDGTPLKQTHHRSEAHV